MSGSKMSEFTPVLKLTNLEFIPVIYEGDTNNYRIDVALLCQALGLKLKGKLNDVADLPPALTSRPGDIYIIGTHFYGLVSGAWTDLGDFIGPPGQDGLGLNVRGSFPSTDDLPMVDNHPGDTYIIKTLMWVWDGEKWAAVGQQGPSGASAFEDWKALQPNPDTVTFNDFMHAITGPQGERGLPGQKGDTGAAGANASMFLLKGTLASSSDLPQSANPSDCYYIGQNVWVFSQSNGWVDMGQVQGTAGPKGATGDKGDPGDPGKPGSNGRDGTNGKSAYQLATENGFSGSVAEWLLSLRGEDGLSVYQLAVKHGFVGDEVAFIASLKQPGLAIKGVKTQVSDLPPTGKDGESWLIGDNVYVWTPTGWVDGGPVRGPQGRQGDAGGKGDTGQSAYDLAKAQGFVGSLDDWLLSLKGARGNPGAPLIPKGKLSAAGELPAAALANMGWMYHIGRNAYISDGSAWIDYGDQSGPEGPQGPDGKTAYQLAQEAGYQGDVGAWLASLIGPEGKSAYQVAVDAGFEGNVQAWLLTLVGPQGPRGGDGPQGPMGPGVKILGVLESSASLPSSGTLGEGYLIAGNFWGWTGAAYEDLGKIQGPQGERGPQGDEGRQGIQGERGPKGDEGNRWICLPREPQPIDGRINDLFFSMASQTVYQKTTNVKWSELGKIGGGNVYDTDSQSKIMGRLFGRWVEIIFEVTEAPTDGLPYVRQNGAWKPFDLYSLKVIDVTDGVLDFAQAQGFNIDGTQVSTLTVKNLPADRMMTGILNITGKGGVITWPSTLKWSNEQAPTMGKVTTTILLYWNGKTLLGQAGPTANV